LSFEQVYWAVLFRLGCLLKEDLTQVLFVRFSLVSPFLL
ncbi:hypothetical protein D043_0519B, partial [Vibrio parahaemolyticus EKP-021]